MSDQNRALLLAEGYEEKASTVAELATQLDDLCKRYVGYDNRSIRANARFWLFASLSMGGMIFALAFKTDLEFSTIMPTSMAGGGIGAFSLWKAWQRIRLWFKGNHDNIAQIKERDDLKEDTTAIYDDISRFLTIVVTERAQLDHFSDELITRMTKILSNLNTTPINEIKNLLVSIQEHYATQQKQVLQAVPDYVQQSFAQQSSELRHKQELASQKPKDQSFEDYVPLEEGKATKKKKLVPGVDDSDEDDSDSEHTQSIG